MKRIINKVVSLVLLSTLVLSLSACGSKEGATAEESNGLKVGIVLTTSGKGDKSFNDSAIAGLEKAKAELNITYKDIQPKDVADIEKSIDFLAKEKYDLVFAVGFNAATALTNVAPKYPDTNFVIIDHDFKDDILPNLKSLVFKEEEGSFLAGVLAAEQSETGVVGFIGGMESPLIKKFEAGYAAGAKAANPEIQVLSTYVSSDPSGFNNPSRAKEIALNMISKKADILYHAAGSSGQGMIDAAAEKNVFAIGCDSNQNWLKPGNVIASMLKRVDNAVFDIVDLSIKNEVVMGDTQIFGLDVDGVQLTDLSGLTVEETTGVSEDDQTKIKELKSTITDETKALIEDYKKQIIEGKIVVPVE